MPTRENFITIYTAYGEPEAEIIKGRLEFEGIPVILKYEALGHIFGIMVDGLGGIKIQVPEPLADEARKIIHESDNISPDSTDLQQNI